MMQNSDQAPANWRIDQAEAKIRELVLKLAPDFVFFQELPGLVPYVETHDLVPVSTVSHCGNIATIVRKDLMDDLESKAVARFGVMTTVKSAGITFVNVHLESGKNAEHKRLDCMHRIVNDCHTPGLAIIGDTNTRVDEAAAYEPIGLLGTRPPQPTWNTKVNHFRSTGRAFTAYYTRYFHNHRVRIQRVQVWNEPIKAEGREFHLSDHFALSGRVSLLKPT